MVQKLTLIKTSVAYTLGHTKKTCWRKLNLAGYNVYVRDGCMKTVLLNSKFSWTKMEENLFVHTVYHKSDDMKYTA